VIGARFHSEHTSGEVAMAFWSFAPWLIALVIAAGLGGFGWFTDRNKRRSQDEADQGPSHDER
jgi:hypothetical protein